MPITARKLLCTSAASILMAGAAVASEQPDYAKIADNLVNYALEIQPNESVIISGTPAQIPLLEELVVATWKAGGKPTVELTLPNANKRAVMSTPLQHLAVGSRLDIIKAKAVDAYINVGSIEDPGLFADVPEERFSALRKANLPLADAMKVAKFRSATLGQSGGVPTEAFAKSRGADYSEMSNTFWKAVAISGDDLKRNGKAVQSQMKAGSKIRVKSAHGTNLSLDLGSQPSGLNTGRTADNVKRSGPSSVWFPAGEFYACAADGSANGTIVIPSMTFRGTPVRNLRATFADGKLTDISADEGEKLLKGYFSDLNDDSHRLTVIDLGLNTESRPPKNSDYLSWEMGGVVTLALGDGDWAGCGNDADGGFTFHVSDADVTADDRPVIRSGQLQLADR